MIKIAIVNIYDEMKRSTKNASIYKIVVNVSVGWKIK